MESRVLNFYAEVLEGSEVTVFQAVTSDHWLADETSAFLGWLAQEAPCRLLLDEIYAEPKILGVLG